MQRTDIVGERYVLRDSLGRGGMGEVYLARDELLGRDVAVKLLKAQHAENPQFVERFRREAKNAAALSHQNIVSVYDAGESPDGTPYMAMEYVGGGTLAERIETEGPLDALEAAGITLQVACALQEAHEKGVIHRDIKPHNIFLAERSEASASSSATSARAGGGAEAGTGGVAPGSVKVGDFGIARAGAETAMTETSLIIGTVRYLSPEQAMGTEVGPQSDLYSLGIVLYEMLTGRVPFDAENPIAIAMKHLSEAPTPPREINPGVPEGIQTITLRLLSKDPEDRYAVAAALIADLERVGRGLPPERLPSEGLPPTNPGAEDAENETDFLQGKPAARASGPTQGRGVRPSRHPVRRTRRRRRIAFLAAFAVFAGALALVGGEYRVAALSSVYNGFSPEGGAQRVEGMRSVDASSAVEIPTTRVDAPDVVGDTEAAAEKTLGEAGFEVEKRSRETSEKQEGTVLSQEPNPGKRVQRGAAVTITVAQAPVKAPTATVPDLTGLDVGEAGGRLSEAGLVLGEQVEAYSNSTSAGLILSQDSLSGAELERGASVGVTVSLGPEPAAVTTTIPDQEPAAGPEPAPEPEPSLAPGSEPAPEPEPSSVPEAQPTPEVEPAPAPAQQEPVQAPVQEPAQEPVQQEPATQPAPEPQPEPSAPTVPTPEPEPTPEPTPEPAPGVPAPEQAPSEPGNPPSGEPAGADSIVPATPKPVVPTMPGVFDN